MPLNETYFTCIEMPLMYSIIVISIWYFESVTLQGLLFGWSGIFHQTKIYQFNFFLNGKVNYTTVQPNYGTFSVLFNPR